MSNHTLNGKVALITGASSGIGRATALALASQGACLALAARRADLLASLEAEVRNRGGQALACPTDVTDRLQVENLVQSTLAAWGRLDILISNAGVYLKKPILDLELADLERSMALNFYGHVNLVLAARPSLLRQKSGHILLMATMDAKTPIAGDAPYVAAKFALSGFGSVLRQELRPLGIAVTTIYPGRIDTPMIETLRVPAVSAKISPKAAARAILRAIRTRPAELIIPPQAFLLYLINFISPTLSDYLSARLHLQGWEN